MKKITLLSIAALLFSGCTSNKVYYNSRYATHQQQAQFKVDDANCSAYSINSVDTPSFEYIPSAQSNNIDTGGTFEAHSMEYGSIRGTYNPGIKLNTTSGFSDGFSRGMSMGSQMANISRARNVQSKLYNSCMIQLGWRQVESASRSAPPARSTPPTRSESLPIKSTNYKAFSIDECPDWLLDMHKDKYCSKCTEKFCK